MQAVMKITTTGTLSIDEINQKTKDFLDTFDTDGDGFIQKQEWLDHFALLFDRTIQEGIDKMIAHAATAVNMGSMSYSQSLNDSRISQTSSRTKKNKTSQVPSNYNILQKMTADEMMEYELAKIRQQHDIVQQLEQRVMARDPDTPFQQWQETRNPQSRQNTMK